MARKTIIQIVSLLIIVLILCLKFFIDIPKGTFNNVLTVILALALIGSFAGEFPLKINTQKNDRVEKHVAAKSFIIIKIIWVILFLILVLEVKSGFAYK